MKITVNPDKELVKKMREEIQNSNGFCPCKTTRNKEDKCMCIEFVESKKIRLMSIWSLY